MLISLQGDNATNLAEIVNAVTDSYLEETKGEEFYGRDKRLESLRQERTEVQNELNRQAAGANSNKPGPRSGSRLIGRHRSDGHADR